MDPFTITFVPSGRGKAQCPSNPDYPNGVEVDMSLGKTACPIDLPYPAPECGYWLLSCNLCGTTVAITAAGRPDDPRKARVPCLTEGITKQQN